MLNKFGNKIKDSYLVRIVIIQTKYLLFYYNYCSIRITKKKNNRNNIIVVFYLFILHYTTYHKYQAYGKMYIFLYLIPMCFDVHNVDLQLAEIFDINCSISENQYYLRILRTYCA